jgi:hypothetical protein
VDTRALHVLYVVKENKTFDQYFGDINGTGVPQANADPSFLLYGENTTTNQHRLAAQYSLSDNFWADSEQSTTGHSWTSAGYVTEYNEITWNPQYSQGFRGDRWSGQYDGQFSGPKDPDVAAQEGALFAPRVRLVDEFADPKLNRRGATFRIYSDDVNDGSKAQQAQVSMALWGIGASAVHHGRDLDFPDTDRAAIFLHGHTVSNAWSGDKGPPPPSYHKEIGLCGAPDDPMTENAPDTFCSRPGASQDEYSKFTLDAWTAAYKACRKSGGTDARCQRTMPNFIYMALPVDHTLGFNPNTPTPASMVANNDYAVGQIADALSRTPFWKNTLMLITEDDTQLAGDHVDAHRTFLLTVGGLARLWGKTGQASHQGGSYPSILKTIEVLFHLPSLTIYDRAAVPLHDVVIPSLSKRTNLPYQAVQPSTRFALNPPSGLLARISERLDWNELDAANPAILTDLVYHYYRGLPLERRDFALLRGRVPGRARDADG